MDYPIKTIRLDNTCEFTSQAFNSYCTVIRIDVEHLVAHVHTKNGLVESLIKRLQLIANVRPTSNLEVSPLKLVLGQEPNIST